MGLRQRNCDWLECPRVVTLVEPYTNIKSQTIINYAKMFCKGIVLHQQSNVSFNLISSFAQLTYKAAILNGPGHLIKSRITKGISWSWQFNQECKIRILFHSAIRFGLFDVRLPSWTTWRRCLQQWRGLPHCRNFVNENNQ